VSEHYAKGPVAAMRQNAMPLHADGWLQPGVPMSDQYSW